MAANMHAGALLHLLYCLLVFIMCCKLTVAFFRDDQCPQQCTCSVLDSCGGLALHCNNKELDSIPHVVPPGAKCLYLQGNNISRIEHLKSLHSLELLDLSHNKIETIDEDAFISTKKLSTLLLSNNKLLLSSESTVPRGAFAGLNSLTHLDFSRNHWGKEALEYRDDIFRYLTNLTTLSIDGLPRGMPFGQAFSHLKKLRILSLHNGLTYISNVTFEAFNNSDIAELCIMSEQLEDIEPMAFSHFKQLKTLQFKGTVNLGVRNASHGWYGLQFTQIQHLYLQSIEQKPVKGGAINVEAIFFEYLNLSKITTLYMENNYIGFLEPQFPKYLPYLEVVSLACNSFAAETPSLFKTMRAAAFMKYLKAISFAYQNYIKLRQCPETLNIDIWNIFNSETCDETNLLEPGGTASVKVNRKVSKRTYLSLPPNLKFFNLRGIQSYFPFTKGDVLFVFGGHRSLLVDFSENNGNSLSGQILSIQPKGTCRKVHLLLRSNGITELSGHLLTQSIENGVKVHQIDLFDNSLGPQLHEDEAGQTFHAYKDLTSLNLGSNAIKALPGNTFKTLTNLVDLNLTSNSLRHLSFNFSQMEKLQSLDLSHNLISYLNQTAVDALDALIKSQKTNLTLYLSGNTFICACETLPFLHWIQQTKVNVKGYAKYECIFKGRRTNLKEFYDVHLYRFEKNCMSKFYVTAAVIVTVCIVIGFSISFCLYMHRWDIKFYCLSVANKKKLYQALLDEPSRYEYDAFVAYHKNDIRWVKTQLLINLEGHNRGIGGQIFKLCLHHRDFMPGTKIEENIVESINKSRKTILVLSNSFVTSGWCDFELQMARLRCFDVRKDLILVIMLEPVPAHAMSKTLRTLIRRTTYIEWKDGQHFWDRVKRSLQAPSITPLTCECGHIVNS